MWIYDVETLRSGLQPAATEIYGYSSEEFPADDPTRHPAREDLVDFEADISSPKIGALAEALAARGQGGEIIFVRLSSCR